MDRLLDYRNRLLADTNIQRRLARSVFTRWIAKNKARALFDLTVGFVYSQTLYTCIKLDIFEYLRCGPESVGSLVKQTGLPEKSLTHLLQAACALELLTQRRDGQYALGELGAALLGNPGVSSMILHHERLYTDLADPVEVLQQGRGESMQSYWPYANEGVAENLSGQAISEYSALMASSQSLIADDVLDAYSFSDYQRLLDIGGGEGAFVATALGRWPDLNATLLDLPAVANIAAQRFEKLGIADRARTVGANMFKDAYPEKHDLVTLVRVLHDHDDEAVLHILNRCHRALTRPGTLVVAEPMAGNSADGRAVSAYFHLYLLAMGSGRPRTPNELKQLLKNAGFNDIRRIATSRPLITQMVVAKKV